MDEPVNTGFNRGMFSRQGWIGSVAFVSIFLIIGLGTLAGGVIWARKAAETFSWPQARGEITTSRVINDSSGGSQMYRVDVQYRYFIGDTVYSGNRVADYTYSSSDFREMQRLAARYLPRQEVKVYYEPGNPQNALLEPGYGLVWIPFLIGGIFTLVGAGMGLGLVVAFRRPPDAPARPTTGAKRKFRRKEKNDADF